MVIGCVLRTAVSLTTYYLGQAGTNIKAPEKYDPSEIENENKRSRRSQPDNMKNINSTIREQREAFKVIIVDKGEIDKEKNGEIISSFRNTAEA